MASRSAKDDFEQLVDEHKVALYRYVCRRVPAADADDVVAEVLAAAWRHRDDLPDHVDLWLYRTAWNAMLHQFRAARRRHGLVQRLIVTREVAVEEPPGAAVDNPLLAALRQSLPRLNPSDQEILRLTYWEGLTAADVAFVLGDGTESAIRVRLHRARKRLAADIARAQRQPYSSDGIDANPAVRVSAAEPMQPDGSTT